MSSVEYRICDVCEKRLRPEGGLYRVTEQDFIEFDICSQDCLARLAVRGPDPHGN